MGKTEADIQRAVERALQRQGFWPKHIEHYRTYDKVEQRSVTCSVCGHKGKVKLHTELEVMPEHPGRPDLTVPHPKGNKVAIPYCEIEVKSVRAEELGFHFKTKISDKQWKYMNNWVAEGGHGFVAVGKIIETAHGTAIHGIHIVPWVNMLAAEAICLADGTENLPFSLSLYKRLPINLYDFAQMFPNTALVQDEEGEWHIPAGHALYVQEEVPLPTYQ